jgi:flagellar protein FlaI
MVEVALPFGAAQVEPIPDKHLKQCGLYKSLSKELQDECEKHPYLLQYLHLVPVEKTGTPIYTPKLDRKLGDLATPSVVYPVGKGMFVHILADLDDSRDFYIAVEPSFGTDLKRLIDLVEARLLDYASEFAEVESDEERAKLLLKVIDRIARQSRKHGFSLFGKKDKSAATVLSPRDVEAVKYQLLRDKIGMGALDPLIKDPHIEDISCSGIGNVFVEHKVFKSLKSSVDFKTHDELDSFVLKMSEKIKRPVTLRSPIVDAVLPDGSRVNIVYGRDVSKQGSNFTIRKFAETPLSVLELIEFGSINYMMAAYMSMVIGDGLNVFVSGETASGKTTLMNAFTTFIQPDAKIVSIEDTPELQVPHKNWIREVSKMSAGSDVGTKVTMFDLLKAALRQRPNIIIIGEIRGEEGAIAFQAMQTGHACMATFHAASVEKLIQRLTGHPISVPKTYVDNLNVVVIQSAVRLPNGKKGRRALSISEIVGYDPSTNSFSFIEAFRWDPVTDRFEFVGYMNSYILEQKIALRRGIPAQEKNRIYQEVERRARILEKLHKERGVRNFYDLLKVLSKAKKEGQF